MNLLTGLKAGKGSLCTILYAHLRNRISHSSNEPLHGENSHPASRATMQLVWVRRGRGGGARPTLPATDSRQGNCHVSRFVLLWQQVDPEHIHSSDSYQLRQTLYVLHLLSLAPLIATDGYRCFGLVKTCRFPVSDSDVRSAFYCVRSLSFTCSDA